MTNDKGNSELLTLPVDWHIHYDHSAGVIVSHFLASLGQGEIIGRRCPECSRVWLPPRAYCEACFVPTTEWVPVGPDGTLESFTIVGHQFENLPKPPYIIAFVRLDGADTALANFLKIPIDTVVKAAQQLRVGTRVQVEFEAVDKRQQRITDFHYIVAK